MDCANLSNKKKQLPNSGSREGQRAIKSPGFTLSLCPSKAGAPRLHHSKDCRDGCFAIAVFITAHTAVQRINVERMRANAIEAAEQCGILTLPEIKPSVKLQTLLKAYPDERAVIFCDERSSSSSPVRELEKLKDRKIAVLVGPEGGFSEDEQRMLRSRSFVHPISLGPRILRADTAAVAVLALVNAVLGDWR